ncbi:hypothetical protein ACIRTB_11385 [Streptomyces sp. NPDC101158]|uniref:hypothetical protein n=1 Tax=Streptomyces sp. NPDC101158 TaxID=3366117 RepID=UPI00381F20B5
MGPDTGTMTGAVGTIGSVPREAPRAAAVRLAPVDQVPRPGAGSEEVRTGGLRDATAVEAAPAGADARPRHPGGPPDGAPPPEPLDTDVPGTRHVPEATGRTTVSNTRRSGELPGPAEVDRVPVDDPEAHAAGIPGADPAAPQGGPHAPPELTHPQLPHPPAGPRP